MTITRASMLAGLVRTLMADGKPRTAQEIAAAVDRDVSKVNDFLRLARAPGRHQELHAMDRGGNHGAVRYVIGKGENTYLRACPVSDSQIHEEEMTDEQLDALHRPRAKWWPKADPTLLNAVNAIVRMGVRQ
jgi:hypothetical protein